MSELLPVMLLGEDPGSGLFDDAWTWYIIIAGIVAALSSLFKKKSQEQQKSDQPQPTARPVPQRPGPPPPRPDFARRPDPQTAPAARPVPQEPETYLFPRPVPEAVARKRTPTRPRMEPATDKGPPAIEMKSSPAEPVKPIQANLVRTRLRALLRERSSLQAGIVLSEILSSPVGLREDPPR
ncbi:MAG: hypothetical protein ABIG44_00255 [Planctomycetota bacterium]